MHVEQPQPVPNARPLIHDQVCADLQARKAIGVERYGQALQPFNGRDAGRDAYEECLDMAVYLRQRRTESEELNQLTDQLVRAAQSVVSNINAELADDAVLVSALRGAVGRYVQAAEAAGVRPLIDLNAGYIHVRKIV